MIGSPHSEKTDEKIERVENHKKKKNYKGKVLFMERWRVPSV